MARIRTVKPSFFRSKTIHKLTYAQRLTFIGLWTHCDDEGRCEYDPDLIKADLWPRDDRSVSDVEDDVRVLTELSLIDHYVVGERSYIQVKGWCEHQRVNRPTASQLPPPEKGQVVALTSTHEDSVSVHGVNAEPSVPEGNKEGNKEGKGTDSLRSSGASAPKRSKPRRRLPDDWAPTDAHRKYAAEHGIDIDHEVGQFRSHAEGKDRQQADWDAAFRTWLGNEVKWDRPRQPQAVPAADGFQLPTAPKEIIDDPDPTVYVRWARAQRDEWLAAQNGSSA